MRDNEIAEEKGSTLFVFEGSQDDFYRILSLFEDEQLSELLGITVLDVGSLVESQLSLTGEMEDIANDPIAAGIAFLESNDPIAVRVRERLENRSISEIVAQLNAAYQSSSATRLPYTLVDILAGSQPTAQKKNFRSASEGSDKVELLGLARDLAKKLAEIWGYAT